MIDHTEKRIRKNQEPKLIKFESELIYDNRKKTGLIRLPDPATHKKDHKGVWIPLIHPGALAILLDHMFVIYPDSTIEYTKLRSKKLDQEKQSTIVTAIKELKIPPLIATDKVFNHNLTLPQLREFFGTPQATTPTPQLISIDGASSQGKSIFALWLEYQGEIVFDFDPFSKYTTKKYRRFFPTPPTNIQDLVTTITSHCNDSDKNEKDSVNPQSILEILDSLSQLFQNGQRPPRVILDMPGFKTDIDGCITRPPDIYDILAKYSVTNMLVLQQATTHKTITPETINDYWTQFLKLQHLQPSTLLTDFIS